MNLHRLLLERAASGTTCVTEEAVSAIASHAVDSDYVRRCRSDSLTACA